MSDAELVRRFTYHAPTPEQADKYARIRETALSLARMIVELAPNNRERLTAVSYLDAVVMNANASIARGPEPPLVKTQAAPATT
ncbi:MAG TPA: hypothetical protein VNO50_10870 [Pyrinomonadaceae bacterium]|nr:hypothetical protein [Pyrinomonadaceae bacterium]